MKKRIVIGGIIIIAVVLYSGFNIWVYRLAKSGGAPQSEKILQPITGKGAGFGSFQRESEGHIPTLTPRPTGPGPFACSPDGACNSYGEEMRKQCPITFADYRCLDTCDDASKRCGK